MTRHNRLPALTVRAILRDYANGLLVREIVARYGVSTSVLYKYVNLHGVERAVTRETVRPAVRCTTCGIKCQARHGQCRSCTKAGAEIELVDGRWVMDLRRRVMVWEPECDRVAS